MRISDWSSDVCSSDLIHHPDPERPQREFVGQQVSLDRRRIAVLAFKGIGEPLCQRRQGRLARIDVYRTSAHMKKLPQVVDAVTMIGMVMGVDDCVDPPDVGCKQLLPRSEEHTSELQSLMRISYAVFCLKKKKDIKLH